MAVYPLAPQHFFENIAREPPAGDTAKHGWFLGKELGCQTPCQTLNQECMLTQAQHGEK